MFRNAEKPVRELVDRAGASAPRQPDREGVLLGLSPAGFHELAFADWGPLEDKRPIICVHGLTRQGRDFDYLAKRLVDQGRRVICPDLCRVVGAAAGSPIPTTTRCRNIAWT